MTDDSTHDFSGAVNQSPGMNEREGLDDCHCGKDGHALNSINCPVHGSHRDRPRFFIDHGMIHDRETGKHVTTEPDSAFCDGIKRCCELLNALAERREPKVFPLLFDNNWLEEKITNDPDLDCEAGAAPAPLEAIKRHVESALRWHPVFDDGRGGNDLTLEQTRDLISERLLVALRAPAPSAWQPIGEDQKTGLCFILGTDDLGVGEGYWSTTQDTWNWITGDEITAKVTHYQRLPEPPREKAEKIVEAHNAALRASAPQEDGRALEIANGVAFAARMAIRSAKGPRERSKAIGAEEAALQIVKALSAPPSVALEGREAREKEITRLATVEECASIAEAFPPQIYTDGPTAADRSCKPSTFADIADAIRALTRPQPGGAVAGTERGATEITGE
jgi:hypothetical protein